MAKDFSDPESVRDARVKAERQLDDLLAIVRMDLADLPSEERFLFMMTLLGRLGVQPETGWTIMVVAIERIIMMEQLDSDLSP